jgi:hypothetical protein
VAIVLGVKQPIRPNSERTVERVDLQVAAYNVDGKFFGSKRMQANVAIRAGATGLAEYEVLTSLDLKPGRYQLRMAAHVGSLGSSGSLYADVDVPDLSKTPVTLSSAVLTVTPALVAAPADAFRDFLPVVPTTQRTFTRSDQVSAFLRVHQGGRGALQAVPLRAVLRDAKDQRFLDRAVELGVAASKDGRAADVRVELPLARLAAGAYLLTIDTGSGATAQRRDIRFSVQ